MKAVEPESCDEREAWLIVVVKLGSRPPLLVEYPAGAVWVLESGAWAIKATPPVDINALAWYGRLFNTWECCCSSVRGDLKAVAREESLYRRLERGETTSTMQPRALGRKTI